MTDLKISQFTDGGPIQETDEIATNRSGVNTKVFVGSVAALDYGLGASDVPTNSDLGSAAYLDVGTDVADIVQFGDDGGGNPQYPPGDGGLITGIIVDAEDVNFVPSSSSSITANNVEDAILEVEQIAESKLEDITGLVTADSGSDILITGSGTVGDPYNIDYVGGSSSTLPAAAFTSAEISITASSVQTVAHGLGYTPRMVRLSAICKTASNGYAVGNIVYVSMAADYRTTISTGTQVQFDSTNVYLIMASGGPFPIVNKSTYGTELATVANWRFLVEAW